MRYYKYICFSYNDIHKSRHFHFLRKRYMKEAMRENMNCWDTFSFGEKLPKWPFLLRLRHEEVGGQCP